MISSCIDPFKQPRYKLITCAVLTRESYYCAALSKNTIDVTTIGQGLHDMGHKKMSARLQRELDAVDSQRYEAILLGYGLCNNGTAGLRSSLPLVIPRAHDCITLLMGSKERYKKYTENHTGAFFQSPGWLEQYIDNLANPESTTSLMGIKEYDEYVKEYGTEIAEYLTDTLGGGIGDYDRFTYVDSRVGDQRVFKDHTRKNAVKNNWKYQELEGNMNLLMRMMNGEWDEEDFLVVQPGQTIQPSYSENVVTAG